MAFKRVIRIHQYLDDWLVRARSHHTCLQHTQTLVALCTELGWLLNREKSELDPQQVFNFIGYQFDLIEGKVKPTPERWQAYKLHINHLELKAVFLALKEFQDLCLNNIVLIATDNTTVVAYINKEGGGGMKTGNSQSSTHPRLAERDSRQIVQIRPDHSNGMVLSPRGLPNHILQVAPAPSGTVCHQVQQQTTTVCVTGSRPAGLGS